MAPAPVPSLRAARLAQGRTIQEVAQSAGTDAASVSCIERGRQDPKLSTLRRLCATLDLVDVEVLLAALVGDVVLEEAG